MNIRATYAAGEKLSLYSGAEGLLSRTTAMTVFPLSSASNHRVINGTGHKTARGTYK